MSLALGLSMLGMATLTFNSVRVGGLAISDLFFIGAAGITVVALLTGHDGDLARRRARRGSSLVLVGSVVLLTASTLSSFFAVSPLTSMSVVLRFGYLTFLWFWLMRAVCRDRVDMDRLLRAWCLSVVLSSIAAMLGQFGIAFVTEWAGRQKALTNHPNHLGMYLSSALVLFVLSVPRREGDRFRMGTRWFAGLVLVTTAMFTTGSMTAFLAATASVAAVAAVHLYVGAPRRDRRPRSTLRPLAVIALTVAGIAVLYASNLPIVDRFGEYRAGDEATHASVDARGDRDELVINRFDDFLVVGLGYHFGEATQRVSAGSDPAVATDLGVHNMHLGVLYQGGLPALVGLLVIQIAAARQAIRLVVNTRRTEWYPIALALFGSFVSLNVTALFAPIAWDRVYWLPVALIGAMWCARRWELRAPPREHGGRRAQAAW